MLTLGRLVPPRRAKELCDRLLEGPFIVDAGLEPAEVAGLAADLGAFQERLRGAAIRPMSFFDYLLCRRAERLKAAVVTFDEGIIAAIRARLFPGARVA